jgi:hypothetical protein
VTAGANLEVPGFADPVTACWSRCRMTAQPLLNRLFLRAGGSAGRRAKTRWC